MRNGCVLFEVLSPISREELHSLISFALEKGGFACLVVRTNQALSPAGDHLLSALEDYIASDSLKSSWPGTMLLEEKARVLTIRLAPESARLLETAIGPLSRPLEAGFPEDLGFLDSSGRPWFASISHEGQAFVEMNPWELAQLKHAVAGMRLSEGITDQSLDPV